MGLLKEINEKRDLGLKRKLDFKLGGKKRRETIVLYGKILRFSNVMF